MSESVRQLLLSQAEPEFREFTSKLMPGVEHVLGVRLPKLRILAKSIAREDWRGYLDHGFDDSYEEIMLQGMVIGYADMELQELFSRIRWFVKKIDNWSVCDSFCTGLKAVKKCPAMTWSFLQPYFRSRLEFEVRFAVVMLLNYFVNEEYARQALEALDGVRHEGYYVRMAVAWAVSIYFIEMPESTMGYLMNNHLDDWTYNKALQKITESLRVDQKTKQKIRAMKRSKTVHKNA